jgi:hypothetical protein
MYLQGAEFALALQQHEDAQRATAAAATASEEPPKKKLVLSFKRAGSGGSEA